MQIVPTSITRSYTVSANSLTLLSSLSIQLYTMDNLLFRKEGKTAQAFGNWSLVSATTRRKPSWLSIPSRIC